MNHYLIVHHQTDEEDGYLGLFHDLDLAFKFTESYISTHNLSYKFYNYWGEKDFFYHNPQGPWQYYIQIHRMESQDL